VLVMPCGYRMPALRTSQGTGLTIVIIVQHCSSRGWK
jgi:hypothetical protein